jgi:hypothetical protein
MNINADEPVPQWTSQQALFSKRFYNTEQVQRNKQEWGISNIRGI